jgi:imidazole glycerol-phosphate synthase subunit HisF
MLTRRIIACLDVAAGRVVKGVQFEGLKEAGDPAALALQHASGGADEIVFLDIAATHEKRALLLNAVRSAAESLFIPLTVGGGIRCLDDAAQVFDSGADKISINSAALQRPEMITEIGNRFGSQAVIVAIDARRSGKPVEGAEVFIAGGRTVTGRNAIAWAAEAESRGAGEILLTSMDCDGMRAGFDCELTAAVNAVVNVPVIASGGAGSMDHFADVFTRGGADAALAASIFHFGVADARTLKAHLADRGIPVRLPC